MADRYATEQAAAALRELMRRVGVAARVGSRRGRVSVLAMGDGWVLDALYDPPKSAFGLREIVADVRNLDG